MRPTHGRHKSLTMLKRYTFWLSAAILFQFLTAVIHTIGLFVRPEPTNETERQLVGLLKTYELNAGLGFSPTYADLFTAMGASFTFLLLFAGFINGYLLIKQTEPVPEVLRAVEQIREQAEPLSELLPALDSVKKELGHQLERLQELIVSLEGDESHLNVTAGKLVDELVAMHKTVDELQDDVKSVTERLPDASKGPLEKARDVLTGGAADPSP